MIDGMEKLPPDLELRKAGQEELTIPVVKVSAMQHGDAGAQHTRFTTIRPDDQVRLAIQEEESEPMNGSQKQRNLKVVASCIAVLGVMIGLTAYAPTAYRLFCAATGFGGTPQRADSYSGSVSDRTVKVRFDANVAPGMPWRFEPVQREVRVHLGEQQLVFFTAETLSDQTIAGRATFNVTPETSGAYFTKIQCFCFDDERLDSHQKVDMPVVFFVDPVLAKDPEMDDLDTSTLSYTFFRSEDLDKAKDLSRFLASARSDPVEGQKLFAERCAHVTPLMAIGPDRCSTASSAARPAWRRATIIPQRLLARI